MAVVEYERVKFQEIVWDYYHENGRDLPWRVVRPSGDCDPYHVLVSELMLQQTQVSRVIPKFQDFIRRFPRLEDLAAVQLSDVLRQWNGLGYNRRAKYLHDAARLLDQNNHWSVSVLESCKGIGQNTAAAIMTYAYNQPHVFIETNIRTVYIHHFFTDADQVSDKELWSVVDQTLDREHPREWYWALMDYGTYLKAQKVKSATKSKHYSRQSAFAGSNRQIRGQVVRILAQGDTTVDELSQLITDDRLPQILHKLDSEGLIKMKGTGIHLA